MGTVSQEQAMRVHLTEVLQGLVQASDRPVPYCGIGVVQQGKIVCRVAAGHRFPGDTNRGENAFDTNHLVRVASVSKPFVALACMRAVQRGLFDLDQDISQYLDFDLRNPHFPEKPITPRTILSHTSSLRDADHYSLPPGQHIREFFLPEGMHWNAGAHFARPLPGYDPEHLAPGHYYEYCNLGFGVIGTVLERVSGRYFDSLIEEWVLKPLGLSGGFSPYRFDRNVMALLTPAYRMDRATGIWNIQVDDPAAPLPEVDRQMNPAGVNATVCSPQGGLRASIDDLLLFVSFMAARSIPEVPELVDLARCRSMLMTTEWEYVPDACNGYPNGFLYDGVSRIAGCGLFRTNDSFDEFGGNRIGPDPGGPVFWGHYGDAYGVLSGVLFDPEREYGYCYIIGGSSADPLHYTGRHSSVSFWEEQIQDAIIEAVPPG